MTLPTTTVQTIPDMLAAAVAAGAEQPALGAIEGGALSWRTWRQIGQQVEQRTAGLRSLGLNRGDRIAQLGPNSVDWILTDLAIQLAGGVHVPIHDSIAPCQAAEQVCHSGARFVLSSQDAEAQASAIRAAGKSMTILTHKELASAGDNLEPAPATVEPGDLATILYTSGTTGAPLGVMLSQRNLVANVSAVCEMIAANRAETRLGVLPLSHIYARTCDLYVWIYRGSKFALAESRQTVVRDCQLVQPTAVNFVPYIYLKIVDGLHSVDPDVPAETLRALLGGQIARCYCGGAALDPQTEHFFAKRGLPILCGYGLSEAAPVVTMSTPANHEPGAVGRPLSNLELKLAEDDEVLVRGPNVMLGYWQDELATRSVLVDGWLRTGDIGQWTTAGNLKIVGRKKEMLVLATGKKVVPTRIEQLLCSSPLIEQACIVGDGKSCLGALVIPPQHVLAVRTIDDPALQAEIHSEIKLKLANLAAFEHVHRIAILPRPFSLEKGEVTAKLSLCRSVIHRHFAAEIERMYESHPSSESPLAVGNC